MHRVSCWCWSSPVCRLACQCPFSSVCRLLCQSSLACRFDCQYWSSLACLPPTDCWLSFQAGSGFQLTAGYFETRSSWMPPHVHPAYAFKACLRLSRICSLIPCCCWDACLLVSNSWGPSQALRFYLGVWQISFCWSPFCALQEQLKCTPTVTPLCLLASLHALSSSWLSPCHHSGPLRHRSVYLL